MERRREVHGVYRLKSVATTRVVPMPFPLIPTALAVGFLLIWVLICGMLFRDGQLAARRERESEPQILPLLPKRHHKNSRVRAAS